MKWMETIFAVLLVWFGTTVQAAAQTGPGQMGQSGSTGGSMMQCGMMGGPMMMAGMAFMLLVVVLLVLAILALVKYLRSERR
ncbi:hypothetical protein [Salinisphaera orenii]|uniref:hypothetical protein n=1 Tax=Salinisphaera orenii TaxID=856731 RepID=UPI0013A6555B